MRLRRSDAIAGGLLALAACLVFWNAGHYYLWGDEAGTGWHAKAILRTGLPYGFDGRNLFEFRNGYFLNTRLLNVVSPWLQYYVAAASIGLFGAGSLGARALFIVLGLVGMGVHYLFVRRWFESPRLAVLNLALMATSATVLLYTRQCRYYSLLLLLVPTLAYLYARFRGRWWELLLACLVIQLLLLSNHLVGVAAVGAMSLTFFLLDDRWRALKFWVVPTLVALAVTGAFFFVLRRHGAPEYPNLFKNLEPAKFARIAWLFLKDYNQTQLLPVGMFAVWLVQWLWAWTKVSGRWPARLRGEFMVALFVALFTLIVSVLSPQSSTMRHSDLRYAVGLFPFLLLIQAFAVDRLLTRRWWLGGGLLVVAVLTNWLTFTPGRAYLWEYVKENARPFDNSVKVAARFLDGRAQQDDVVLVTPNDMLASLEYHLGDKLLFCNVIGEDNRNLLAAGVKLPRYTYAADTVPDWIVRFGSTIELGHVQKHLAALDLRDYETHVLPIFGPDRSRPEIFWHSFTPVRDYETHVLPISGPDMSRPEIFRRSLKPVRGFDQRWALQILQRRGRTTKKYGNYGN